MWFTEVLKQSAKTKQSIPHDQKYYCYKEVICILLTKKLRKDTFQNMCQYCHILLNFSLSAIAHYCSSIFQVDYINEKGACRMHQRKIITKYHTKNHDSIIIKYE